jgi:hypothetical protein
MTRAPKSSTSRRRSPWTRDRNSACRMTPLHGGNNSAYAENPTYRRNPTCPSFRSIAQTAPHCAQPAASLPRRRQLRLIWSDRCSWLSFECRNIRRGTPEGQVPISQAGWTDSQHWRGVVRRLPPACPQARFRPALILIGATFCGQAMVALGFRQNLSTRRHSVQG